MGFPTLFTLTVLFDAEERFFVKRVRAQSVFVERDTGFEPALSALVLDMRLELIFLDVKRITYTNPREG